MPLCAHEDILMFYRKLPTYNPQSTKGKPYLSKFTSNSRNYGKVIDEKFYYQADAKRFPTDIFKYKALHAEHSQQKPTALLEYLIKTYTNEGEVVLDATRKFP